MSPAASKELIQVDSERLEMNRALSSLDTLDRCRMSAGAR